LVTSCSLQYPICDSKQYKVFYRSNMVSFGCFPGVWLLIADVSESSIGSIFLGSSMQYDSGCVEMPKKLEQIEGSETSAINNQTPGKYPKETILHVKHGESLKSRTFYRILYVDYKLLFVRKYLYTEMYLINLMVEILWVKNYMQLAT
jgi:hypothetical protein